jgi:hypothetical protein
MKSRKSFDTLQHGLIPGIILPGLTLIIFWLVRFEGSLIQFLKEFQAFGMLSKTLSLATIPNLLLFFIFLWTDRTFSARGVIFATLLMALVMLVLKFA